MKAKVYGQDGNVKGETELSGAVFTEEARWSLLHQVIKGYLANQRQGTSKTRGRSEVSGGGRKPWRQKGTGRARAGSNTSPVWVRGGKAHGPDPRDYTTHLPKQMRKHALAAALSSRAQNEKIFVVDAISCGLVKTKVIVKLLKTLSLFGKRNLLVTERNATDIYRAGRNIKNLDIKAHSDVTAYDIANNENIVICGEELIKKLSQVGNI